MCRHDETLSPPLAGKASDVAGGLTIFRRVAPALGCVFADYFGLAVIMPVTPFHLRDRCGVVSEAGQQQWAGWISSAQFVGVAVGCLLIGRIADRLGSVRAFPAAPYTTAEQRFGSEDYRMFSRARRLDAADHPGGRGDVRALGRVRRAECAALRAVLGWFVVAARAINALHIRARIHRGGRRRQFELLTRRRASFRRASRAFPTRSSSIASNSSGGAGQGERAL